MIKNLNTRREQLTGKKIYAKLQADIDVLGKQMGNCGFELKEH
jgi:hypothetical protein